MAAIVQTTLNVTLGYVVQTKNVPLTVLLLKLLANIKILVIVQVILSALQISV